VERRVHQIALELSTALDARAEEYATGYGERTAVPPHPDPLPQGEGTAAARRVFCAHWLGQLRRGLGPETADDSPSPQGRGPG
jgi:hypothetical protein